MSQEITRKHFLHLSVGATAATLLGCGDDSSGDGDSGTSDATDPTTTSPTTTSPTTTSPTTTSPTTTSPTTTMSDDSTTTDATDATTDATDPTTESTDPSDTTMGDSGTTGAAGCVADPTIAIGGHAGHVLVVTLAEVQAGVEVVYDIMGASPHTHSVVITAEDFATLQATGMVVVTSSFDSSHEHEVTLMCG
jgi:uncharacterized protein YycO